MKASQCLNMSLPVPVSLADDQMMSKNQKFEKKYNYNPSLRF